MASSTQLINTIIHCGHHLYTAIFNDQSSIDQIHEQVRYLCGSQIPNSFHLTFYNNATKKIAKLNQNQLDNKSSPFRLNSSNIESPVHVVDLSVIDNADENDTPSGILCDEASLASSRNLINETESQEDVPISDEIAFGNDHHSEELLNALLRNEEDVDINTTMHSLFTDDTDESLAAYPNDNQSDSNFSSNDTFINNIDSTFQYLVDALLTERQPIQNPLGNNDSSEQIATGVAMPPQDHSSISNQCQPSIELDETQDINLNHLYFSLDVKPEQKDIYISDQFNQKEKTKLNGYVARIQGIKTPAQRMSSIWPKVRIPKLFRNKRNVRLVVFAVSEKLQNGMRIWLKHRDKGFLPKGFTRESSSINPIEFDVNESNLTIEGDLKLDLQMTTLWDKSNESKQVYQLDEQSTIDLHPATHDPSSPRLFCILKDDRRYYMNTICLSDFIRSKGPSKRNLTITNNTVQTNVIACKRARAK